MNMRRPSGGRTLQSSASFTESVPARVATHGSRTRTGLADGKAMGKTEAEDAPACANIAE
jgi:hypothetical protein